MALFGRRNTPDPHFFAIYGKPSAGRKIETGPFERTYPPSYTPRQPLAASRDPNQSAQMSTPKSESAATTKTTTAASKAPAAAAAAATKKAATSTPAPKGKAAAAAAKKSKVIFNAKDVVATLLPLKKAASEKPKGYRWYSSALTFDTSSYRKGNNGTSWFDITLKMGDVSGRLIMRIFQEAHVGQIMPDSDAEVARMMAENKNSKRTYKKRDKGVSLQFNKWNARLTLEEDGITFKKDAEGKPILPSDDTLSMAFMALWLVDDAFQIEMRSLLESKRIMSRDAYNTAEADGETIPAGTLVAPNTKIASRIQTRVSAEAAKNANKFLPNPMARVDMKFKKDTGEAEFKMFDKQKPYTVNGQKKYEMAKVDGQPVNATNVHKFVLSGSRIDGIMNADSVCFSNMGISIPAKVEIAVVDKPEKNFRTEDDVYEDDEDGEGTKESSTNGTDGGDADGDGDGGDGGDGGDDGTGDDVDGDGNEVKDSAATSEDVAPRASDAPDNVAEKKADAKAAPAAITDDDYSSLIDGMTETDSAKTSKPAGKPAASRTASATKTAAKPAAK